MKTHKLPHQEKQLEQWVQEHTETLLRYAHSRVGSKELAQDLVQETFIAAYHSKFAQESKVSTWLIGILRHKIMDEFRKSYRQEGHQAELLNHIESEWFGGENMWQHGKSPDSWKPLSTDLLDNTRFLKILELCMQSLPALWEKVMRIRFLQQEEGSLDVSDANAWQIAHRAKLKLRKCIELSWQGKGAV
jgi:RNA polymerase sigma factor (sigma-70 family)